MSVKIGKENIKWDCRKCERHVHMGGSISPATIWKIIQRSGQCSLAGSEAELQKMMVCQKDDEKSFQAFLRKFNILDKVEWDAWAIDTACRQICEDTKLQGTAAMDISFSVEKYVRSGLWSHRGAVSFIVDAFKRHSAEFGIEVGPFLSISYHAPVSTQIAVAELINEPTIADAVIGLDLVGDESYYDSDFYGKIIEKWNKAGKITREHLAEMPGTSSNLHSVLTRPESQRPKRIAHGIQGLWEDLRRAADAGIYFDLAIHSNLRTGAILDILYHPLPKMLKAGCLVTLNTDDPVQFGCTLDDEYGLAIRAGLISHHEAKGIQENAVASLR